MASSTVPKSLHTVTVLVVIASHLLESSRNIMSVTDAVYMALEHLGYAPETDHYGLAEQAIKKIHKQVKVCS